MGGNNFFFYWFFDLILCTMLNNTKRKENDANNYVYTNCFVDFLIGKKLLIEIDLTILWKNIDKSFQIWEKLSYDLTFRLESNNALSSDTIHMFVS